MKNIMFRILECLGYVGRRSILETLPYPTQSRFAFLLFLLYELQSRIRALRANNIQSNSPREARQIQAEARRSVINIHRSDESSPTSRRLTSIINNNNCHVYTIDRQYSTTTRARASQHTQTMTQHREPAKPPLSHAQLHSVAHSPSSTSHIQYPSILVISDHLDTLFHHLPNGSIFIYCFLSPQTFYCFLFLNSNITFHTLLLENYRDNFLL